MGKWDLICVEEKREKREKREKTEDDEVNSYEQAGLSSGVTHRSCLIIDANPPSVRSC